MNAEVGTIRKEQTWFLTNDKELVKIKNNWKIYVTIDRNITFDVVALKRSNDYYEYVKFSTTKDRLKEDIRKNMEGLIE